MPAAPRSQQSSPWLWSQSLSLVQSFVHVSLQMPLPAGTLLVDAGLGPPPSGDDEDESLDEQLALKAAGTSAAKAKKIRIVKSLCMSPILAEVLPRPTQKNVELR